MMCSPLASCERLSAPEEEAVAAVAPPAACRTSEMKSQAMKM